MLQPCEIFRLYPTYFTYTVDLHLSGLIGIAKHPNMTKIRIIEFFFENWLLLQFEVRLLLVTVGTCV
jgi:hypothetical protein